MPRNIEDRIYNLTAPDAADIECTCPTCGAVDYVTVTEEEGDRLIDGDQVTIKDPEGHLDTSVPTPVIDDLGRGDRRRVRFEEDQKLWAWNLPYLLRGPYLLATRA